MIPEWKTQYCSSDVGSTTSIIGRKQSMYIYQDNEFTNLEPDPYNVFPIGSNGASWIE